MKNIQKIATNLNINLCKYLSYKKQNILISENYFVDYFKNNGLKNNNIDLYKYFSMPIEERKTYCERIENKIN